MASGSKSGKSVISEGKSVISEGGANDSVAFGDVIFIKPRGGSWWPAQVVDENSINKSVKPSKRRKRLPGEVLVRHYGSYIYSYADPVKCRAEFKRIFEQNDGSLRKILLQSLEQYLPSTKSHNRSKGSSLKPKGTSSKDAAGKRKSNGHDKEQNTIKSKKQKTTSNDNDPASQSRETSSLGKSPELSSRRIRVMENLGLIAPAGSPFRKAAHKYNKTP